MTEITRVWLVLMFANALVFVACFEVSVFGPRKFRDRADQWALRSVYALAHLAGAGFIAVFIGWLYWHWDRL